MKKLNDAVDRFAYNHPNFGVPNLMKFIVAGNIIVFLLLRLTNYGIFSFLGFNWGRVLDLEGVTLPQEALDAAKTCSGGSIDGFQLQFTGLCAACRQKLN